MVDPLNHQILIPRGESIFIDFEEISHHIVFPFSFHFISGAGGSLVKILGLVGILDLKNKN